MIIYSLKDIELTVVVNGALGSDVCEELELELVVARRLLTEVQQCWARCS